MGWAVTQIYLQAPSGLPTMNSQLIEFDYVISVVPDRYSHDLVGHSLLLKAIIEISLRSSIYRAGLSPALPPSTPAVRLPSSRNGLVGRPFQICSGIHANRFHWSVPPG